MSVNYYIDPDDPEKTPFLYWEDDSDGLLLHKRVEKISDFELIDLEDLLDHDATHWNHHDFVFHADLSSLIQKEVGFSKTKRIMLRILERGGLHRMKGRY